MNSVLLKWNTQLILTMEIWSMSAMNFFLCFSKSILLFKQALRKYSVDI